MSYLLSLNTEHYLSSHSLIFFLLIDISPIIYPTSEQLANSQQQKRQTKPVKPSERVKGRKVACWSGYEVRKSMACR
jgi:hypothetical protein